LFILDNLKTIMTFRHSYLGFAVVLVMLSSIISCSTIAPDVDEMMDPD